MIDRVSAPGMEILVKDGCPRLPIFREPDLVDTTSNRVQEIINNLEEDEFYRLTVINGPHDFTLNTIVRATCNEHRKLEEQYRIPVAPYVFGYVKISEVDLSIAQKERCYSPEISSTTHHSPSGYLLAARVRKIGKCSNPDTLPLHHKKQLNKYERAGGFIKISDISSETPQQFATGDDNNDYLVDIEPRIKHTLMLQ